ncbi:MAG: hypothetical protein HY873_13230 [Chloroflexi bacterium]|nr:hypothetical protein [Chloroflexota bacterium]
MTHQPPGTCAAEFCEPVTLTVMCSRCGVRMLTGPGGVSPVALLREHWIDARGGVPAVEVRG